MIKQFAFQQHILNIKQREYSTYMLGLFTYLLYTIDWEKFVAKKCCKTIFQSFNFINAPVNEIKLTHKFK